MTRSPDGGRCAGARWLFDIGNSRCKRAVSVRGALSTHAAQPVELFMSAPPALPAAVAEICVVCVRGAVFERALAAHLARRYGLRPRFARTRLHLCGVTAAYAEPHRLGVDRLLALIGARRRHAGACVVVDAGSALTVDALDAAGAHLGGVIMPGRPGAALPPAVRALAGSARLGRGAGGGLGAGLRGGLRSGLRGGGGRDLHGDGAGKVFARDTRAAVAAGARFASCAAVVAAMQARMRAASAVPATVPVFATGGGGARLAAEHGWILRPHLALEGLAVWADATAAEHAGERI